MGNIALYKVGDEYLYSHWGASILTLGWRVDQAIKLREFREFSQEPLSSILSHIDYDGDYSSQTYLPGTNNPFENITAEAARHMVNGFHKGEHTVQAYAEIHESSNQFKYIENPALSGDTYYFSGSLSALRKLAKKAAEETIHRIGGSFSDAARSLREQLLDHPPRGVHYFRSAMAVNCYDLSTEDHTLELAQMDVVNNCVSRALVRGDDAIFAAMSGSRSFDRLNEALKQRAYQYRNRGAEEDPYAAFRTEPFMYRIVSGLPFENEKLTEFKALISDRLDRSAAKKLLILEIKDTAPVLRPLMIGRGEDVTEKVIQALDRGSGVELKMINGKDEDIIGFVNKKDAGRKGNPVVLASNSPDGYFLSEEQVQRLSAEFRRTVPPQQEQTAVRTVSSRSRGSRR